MASTQAKAKTERSNGGSTLAPLSSGDLTLTLNQQQWSDVVVGLSIAAGDAAIRRSYEQMSRFNRLCGIIGDKIGGSLTNAVGGDSSPPMMARAAGAGS